MPPVLYEVSPLGSGLSLWEVLLPHNQHDAFKTAIQATGRGIQLTEDDFSLTVPSKLAGAISGHVYAALLETTPASIRGLALQAADAARRAMAAAGGDRTTARRPRSVPDANLDDDDDASTAGRMENADTHADDETHDVAKDAAS
ncbi:hypothetical protein HK405_010539 [Cladochytrium tenue]|nr:hypothetical protein HK405_010539 [Cladochytrium tenue]